MGASMERKTTPEIIAAGLLKVLIPHKVGVILALWKNLEEL